MNRTMRILVIFCFVAVGLLTLMRGISLSAFPTKGVACTPHDLNNYSGYCAGNGSNFVFTGLTKDDFIPGDQPQICVYCHTPHGANRQINKDTLVLEGVGQTYQNTASGSPVYLWNRALANSVQSYTSGIPGQAGYTAGGRYTLYHSSTLNANVTEVRVYSLMCLSCHDGISAMNVLFNNPTPVDVLDPTGPTGATKLGDDAPFPNQINKNIGERLSSADSGVTNLTNDHPISIDYPSTDAGLVAMSSGTVGTLKLRLFPAPNGVFTSMECSTCHDVHNYGETGVGGAVTGPFLAASNKNSGMCLNCHIK